MIRFGWVLWHIKVCRLFNAKSIFKQIIVSYCELALLTKFLYDGTALGLYGGGDPRGVMFKAIDCGIVVSEFVLQSRYYVHFQANTLGKGMNLLSFQLWVK